MRRAEFFMTDDKTQTSADRKRISIEQEYEVRDWSGTLGCTPEELKAAVKSVGPMADDVRRYLAKK